MMDGRITPKDWTWVRCYYKAIEEYQINCREFCECDERGVFYNDKEGDWCWLKNTPCYLHDGTVATDWTWARCYDQGVGKWQIHCGRDCHKDPGCKSCRCDQTKGVISSEKGDWCHIVNNTGRPCAFVDGHVAPDAWTWARCTHPTRKTTQMICPDSLKKTCCKAMTAECIACSKGMTEEEYCKENPKTTGCPDVEESDSKEDSKEESKDSEEMTKKEKKAAKKAAKKAKKAQKKAEKKELKRNKGYKDCGDMAGKKGMAFCPKFKKTDHPGCKWENDKCVRKED